MCGRKSIFLSVNEYGLCDMCYSYICEDYRNRERILVESRKIIETSKNSETQLCRINVMKEHFQVLLKYEKMGIPITDPPPSVLLKRLDIERDKITKSKNLEINKEPLGRKYKRLSSEFEKQRYNMKEEARQLEKLLENPQYEPNLVEEIRSFEEIRLHNRRLAEILDIMVDRNNKGIELEKKGDIENAIKLYEENVADEFFGTHPYDRLAIIYRKRKQFNDEIRILKRKISIFEKINQEGLHYFLEHCSKDYPKELIEKAKSFKQIRDTKGRVISNPYPVDNYRKRLEKAKILKEKYKERIR